jgi:hypothetical protein
VNVPCPEGCGTVFELSSSGVFTVLHSFDYYTDGAAPWSVVTIDSAGNLYGSAPKGGGGGAGTILSFHLQAGVGCSRFYTRS